MCYYLLSGSEESCELAARGVARTGANVVGLRLGTAEQLARVAMLQLRASEPAAFARVCVDLSALPPQPEPKEPS